MERLQNLKGFVSDYILWIALVILCGAWAYAWRCRKRARTPRLMRDITMTVEGRRIHVQRTVLDKVCDGLLDAYLDGDITSEEANLEMARIAKFYHHEEILPLINDKKTKLLKHRLKKLKRQRSMNGRTEVVPIPEPPPPKKPVSRPKDDGDMLASILA